MHFPRNWFAFFSGSKGFHVYVPDKRFVYHGDKLDFTHERQVEALRRSLPEEFFNMIDISIYAPNKGIRPFTQRNPKDRSSRPIISFHSLDSCWNLQGERPGHFNFDMLFDWLSSQALILEGRELPHECATIARRSEPNMPKQPATVARTGQFNVPERVTYRMDRAAIDFELPTFEQKIEALRQYVKEELRLENLPEVDWAKSREKGACYFEPQDSVCMCDAVERTPHARRKSWWYFSGCYAIQQCIAQRHREKGLKVQFVYVPEVVPDLAPEPVHIAFQPQNQFIAPFLPGQQVLIEPTEQWLPEEKVAELLGPKGSRLIVCAPMGSGKTTALNKFVQGLRRENPDLRVLIVCTRQVQGHVYNGAFQGSEMYLDVQAEQRALYESNYLVVCLNSLLKVLPGRTIPSFDVLILDEIMTTLNALVSPMLSGPNTNQPHLFKLFQTFIHTSQRVVMMDGLPGPELYNFLNDMNVWSQFKVLQHTRLGESKEFIFVKDPYAVEDMFKEIMASPDGSMVMVSDSKKILKHFHGLIPEDVKDQAMTICGETEQLIKKSALNPNANWKHLRYLGYNTALGPGASFDAKTAADGAFDTIVVMITCETCSPSEIYQLLSRIRWPISGKVWICVFQKTGSDFFERTARMNEEERRNLVLTQAMEDITHFDRLCQAKIGVRTLRGAENIMDYTQLSLSEMADRPELVRVLCATQQLRLVYEPDSFLRLLAWSRLEALKYRDSARFTQEFKRLIEVNGGTWRTKPCRLDDGQLIKAQKSWMKTVRKTGRTTESYLFPAGARELETIPSQVKDHITKILDVGDMQTQIRFLSVGRFFTDTSPKDRFAKQIFDYFSPPEVQQRLADATAIRFDTTSKVASSLTVTLLEMHGPYKRLFAQLGLEFDIETGLLSGKFDSNALEASKFELIECLKTIQKLQCKADPSRSLVCPDPNFQTGREKTYFFRKLNAALQSAFKWIGFSMDKASKRRKNPEYHIDPVATKLRYSMAGFQCDTFEEIGKEDALFYFANKYIPVNQTERTTTGVSDAVPS